MVMASEGVGQLFLDKIAYSFQYWPIFQSLDDVKGHAGYWVINLNSPSPYDRIVYPGMLNVFLKG